VELYGYNLEKITPSKKIFLCEKSKLFFPKMLELDVSLFLTIFSCFSCETIMILQNTSGLIRFGLMEVSAVNALVVAIFLFLQGI